MASIVRGGLAFALIILVIVLSWTFQTILVADARSTYIHARELANDCDYTPVQGEEGGCGGGGGGSSEPNPPSGPAPGSSRCKKGCCGTNKFGECKCCQ